MDAKPGYQNLTCHCPLRVLSPSTPSAIHITNLLFQSVNSCPIPSLPETPTSPGFSPRSKMKVRLLAVTLKGFCVPGPAFLCLFLQFLWFSLCCVLSRAPLLGPSPRLSKLCLGGSCMFTPIKIQTQDRTCPFLSLQLLAQCLNQIGSP